MSDERADRDVIALSGLGAQNLLLPMLAGSRPSWSQSSMPTFRCELRPEAELNHDLIIDALETLSQGTDVELTPTSVRIPAPLRALAHTVVEHHWVSSISDLLVTGLRDQLGSLTVDAIQSGDIEDTRAALEEHYASGENERAGLAELTISAAEVEGHRAADHPDLVAQGVEDLGGDAYIEDVLAWVQGALAMAGDATYA